MSVEPSELTREIRILTGSPKLERHSSVHSPETPTQDTESVTRSKYEEEHPNFNITKLGLIVWSEIPWLGFSPDGGVWPHNLIEIKCPRSGKFQTAFLAASEMDCFMDDGNGNLFFKQNHKYFDQMQLGMFLLNLKECHLIRDLKNAYFLNILPHIEKNLLSNF